MTLKRAFDVCVSSVALLLLSPLMIIIAATVRATSPGPALFRQVRIGLQGRPFTMIKFRSMRTDAEHEALRITARRDPRVTPLGRYMRKTKLDELPQLINVLRGDMSIVGPRPEVEEYVALYTPAQCEAILSVKPGITDWASIKFRDEETILARYEDPVLAYKTVILPEKIRLYERYVSMPQLSTDIRIISCTLSSLFRGSRSAGY